MKFMEHPALEMLSQKMHYENDNMTITVRTELYSCKMIRNDRRLLKKYQDDNFEEISYGRRDLLSSSYPSTYNTIGDSFHLSPSPLSSEIFYEMHYKDDLASLNSYRTHVESNNGRKTLVSDQKTLCNMRVVLKYFYDDDQYLDAPGSDFIFIDDLDDVICEVRDLLQPAMGHELTKDLFEEFWHTQDDAICFADCEKYQYQPTIENDTILQSPDTVWYLNYFFYNRKKNQVLFLSLHATNDQIVSGDSPIFCFDS